MKRFVESVLKEKGITYDNLSVKNLTTAFGVEVYLVDFPSKTAYYKGTTNIFIDQRTDDVTQFKRFLHELSHIILDKYSINDYDEIKVKHVENLLFNTYIHYKYNYEVDKKLTLATI